MGYVFQHNLLRYFDDFRAHFIYFSMLDARISQHA
ncbi:hypothetical protein HBA_0771 [Sodalis endosymbiont of Henestaris halophilus]|nr:hypothetical protein HBA_0771 [Sodalis endosymbiont of Henestaris halophilus]